MKKILFTGFAPFGGETINPSFEAVRRLPERIGDTRILREEIPVEYRGSEETLRELVLRLRPDLAVLCGQAGGRDAVTPEYCALNLDHAGAPDNAGEIRRYRRIREDGPEALVTPLPFSRIIDAVTAAGVPCRPSFSAGTYVCNHLYYTLLSMGVPGIFVHVPYLPEQVGGREGIPSLPLEEMTRALNAVAALLA